MLRSGFILIFVKTSSPSSFKVVTETKSGAKFKDLDQLWPDLILDAQVLTDELRLKVGLSLDA